MAGLSRSKERRSGRPLERVVERLRKALDPAAQVETRVRVFDHEANRTREIDVLVRTRLPSGEILTLMVECRDHTKAVGSPYVEQVVTKSRAVNADMTIIVSATGFTSGARSKAAHHGIRLVALSEVSPTEVSSWFTDPVVTQYDNRVNIGEMRFETEDDPVGMEELDLGDAVVDGKVRTTAEFLEGVDGGRWSPHRLVCRFTQTQPAFLADVPTDGTRVGKTIAVSLQPPLTMNTKSGRAIKVNEFHAEAEFWREPRRVPLTLVRSTGDGGEIDMGYTTLLTADEFGRHTVPLDFTAVRTGDGQVRVHLVAGAVDTKPAKKSRRTKRSQQARAVPRREP